MMSVTFKTDDPQALLEKFENAIAQIEPGGGITTWIKHASGAYYTHSSEQWKGRAFFLPTTDIGSLRFNIVRNTKASVTSAVYGYYHGHLIETFLNHFDILFGHGLATSLPDDEDLC